MWEIPLIVLAILATDDKSGDEQNGLALKGLPIVLMPALETGEELYDSTVGEVFGDIVCFIGDFFAKLDGDPTELEELEFFAGDICASSGEVLVLSWTGADLRGGVDEEVRDDWEVSGVCWRVSLDGGGLFVESDLVLLRDAELRFLWK